MMKLQFLILLAVGLLFSCQPKESQEDKHADAEEDTEWQEMEEFHMVMAESFHPFRDSANVRPAKAYAAEMSELASNWQQAELPKRMNTDEAKARLERLSQQCKDFKSIVEASTDEEIGQALTDIHDTFHRLQEAWYKNKSHQ